jgi:hypothetical protein
MSRSKASSFWKTYTEWLLPTGMEKALSCSPRALLDMTAVTMDYVMRYNWSMLQISCNLQQRVFKFRDNCFTFFLYSIYIYKTNIETCQMCSQSFLPVNCFHLSPFFELQCDFWNPGPYACGLRQCPSTTFSFFNFIYLFFCRILNAYRLVRALALMSF